jgi:hypothetical protein
MNASGRSSAHLAVREFVPSCELHNAALIVYGGRNLAHRSYDGLFAEARPLP